MTDLDIACPHCLEKLVLDRDTAGRQVVCPYCDALVKMPPLSVVSAARDAAAPRPVNPAPVAPQQFAPPQIFPQPRTGETRGRDDSSLSHESSSDNKGGSLPGPRPIGEAPRTHAVDTGQVLGRMDGLAAGAAKPDLPLAPAPKLDRAPTQLPQMRARNEPTARPAAAAALAPVVLDLQKVERGGLHGFACPGCGRPLWVKKKDFGGVVTCESCGADVISPDPESGVMASLLNPAAPLVRTRTILPEHRQTGRPVGESLPAPTSELAARPRPDLPAPRPPDEPPKLAPPPLAPVAPPLQVLAAGRADAGPESPPDHRDPDTKSESTPASEKKPANFRLGERSRKLRLTPQGEVEGDPELTGAWGEDQDTAEARRRKNRRLVVAGVAISLPLLAIIVWQALLHFVFQQEPLPDMSLSDGGRAAAEIHRAMDVVNKFLSAGTVDEIAKYVRHPEITLPRMAAWYDTKKRPLKPLKVLSFQTNTDEQSVGDIPFIILFMELDNHVIKAIALEKGEPNYKVDWESYVSWAEMSWQDFHVQQPEEPHDFRVVVEHDTYYNFHYADESQYFCYKLADAENWSTCYGYTGLDSDAGRKINQLIRKQRHDSVEPERVKVILKLHFEPVARGHNQVWIDNVVEDGWVEP